MDYKAILAKLNAIKKQQSMTLKELSERSGISQGTINKIMSGATQKIKADNIAKLCMALGVAESVVLGTESVPAGKPTVSPQNSESCFGLVKVACISPEVRVGDCAFNGAEIIRRAMSAANEGAKVIVFPELAITGYTCGDLFFNGTLRQGALDELQNICRRTAYLDAIIFVGLPIVSDSGLMYNACAAIFRGKVLCVVPKMHLPNYNEFEEKRTFALPDGKELTVTLFGEIVPLTSDVILVNDSMPQMKIAAEICEDIWVIDSPSYRHSNAGATLILNLSASNEMVVKADYRRKLVQIQSGKTCSVYAYCSSGMSESTSATVFSAHNIICENSQIVAESLPFSGGYAIAEVDLDFIANERAKIARGHADDYVKVHFDMPIKCKPTRVYDAMPFVPTNPDELAARCETILNIQSYGLLKRMQHAKASKLVLGVSGGSDSSLALLVCKRALELANRPMTDILAFTMPCFGTSHRTLMNSIALANVIGATVDKIDITSAVNKHLADIKHDASLRDATYENAQARERTQILMDIANRENGLVVGTGDMSEAALGWCTYNGDQMSMYGVNSSVPKTLVLAMLKYFSSKSQGSLKRVLADIADTPVSPELLPAENGEMGQVTENIIGPYELHDYFLFMLLRKGFTPSKVFELAKISFEGKYDANDIYKWERKFLQRFFTQQFKRSCSPDGVKLGSADLNRASFHMPSDACADLWLADLDRQHALKK